MQEYLFEIILIGAGATLFMLGLIIERLCNRRFWEIIVDGETFPVVTHLNIDRKRQELYFFNVTKECWESHKYLRIEIRGLRYVEDEENQ